MFYMYIYTCVYIDIDKAITVCKLNPLLHVRCYLIFASYSHNSNELFTVFPKNAKYVTFS